MDKDCWETPQWLFDELNEEFKFDIDLCANTYNSKTRKTDDAGFTYTTYMVDYLMNEVHSYYTHSLCGQGGTVFEGTFIWKTGFMNPPYSDIKPFLKKAIQDSREGKTIVCVLPVDTSTKWWTLIWDRKQHKAKKYIEFTEDGQVMGVQIEIRFIPYLPHHPSRLKFEYNGLPCKTPYPRPVAVVVLKPLGLAV